MTKHETMQLLAIIRAAYPGWQKGNEQAAAELWAQQLRDIDANRAATALDKHIKTSKFAPTIAEIREGAQISKIAMRRVPAFRPIKRGLLE